MYLEGYTVYVVSHARCVISCEHCYLVQRVVFLYNRDPCVKTQSLTQLQLHAWKGTTVYVFFLVSNCVFPVFGCHKHENIPKDCFYVLNIPRTTHAWLWRQPCLLSTTIPALTRWAVLWQWSLWRCFSICLPNMEKLKQHMSTTLGLYF